MNQRTQGEAFGPADRIAAFARATEAYAEGLEDADLANVYFGKSLGLWQAVAILRADGPPAATRRFRQPSSTCSGRLQPGVPAANAAAPGR